MGDKEIQLFKNYIEKCDRYFEWGCGGSTYIVPYKYKVSIDSSQDWINKIKKDISSNFIYIDIGPVGDWGMPLITDARFPDYSLAFRERYEDTDLILIDGRFRVACALQVFLSGNEGYVLLHDSHREEYDPIYEFFDIIESVDTLKVLKRKSNGDCGKAWEFWEDFKFDPR